MHPQVQVVGPQVLQAHCPKGRLPVGHEPKVERSPSVTGIIIHGMRMWEDRPSGRGLGLRRRELQICVIAAAACHGGLVAVLNSGKKNPVSR